MADHSTSTDGQTDKHRLDFFTQFSLKSFDNLISLNLHIFCIQAGLRKRRYTEVRRGIWDHLLLLPICPADGHYALAAPIV